MSTSWYLPEWSLPAGVQALQTTRLDGASGAPYDSFNLGDHVGDNPHAVAANRSKLARAWQIEPCWLSQVHGIEVVDAATAASGACADAVVSRTLGQACVVMTADCLPVLFASQHADVVAAAHAGWRGLLAGVLENTLKAMATPAEQVSVWLGPAIGPQAFEVGAEVREAFLAVDVAAASAFKPSARAGHYLADLYLLACQRLAACGVRQIAGGGECTFSDSQRFFSYRRAAQTGRQASLIWLSTPR
ncbi:peptidoglycan editing factor PgeF [Atopomonas sediminilitoris]|uniref:peptidoglycan editing factor PgeF n=1 Tax=Atopomonas sediminilitoris TaxID=2919919 RepID=UPI001F4EBAD3|nr:peptidoglycan editing factor PgeF [Atopomonas sediminilitoris]MCJ8169882.1 peptidoglycan editing factor PgeF [Atopomonas sediminilitoris]